MAAKHEREDMPGASGGKPLCTTRSKTYAEDKDHSYIGEELQSQSNDYNASARWHSCRL